MKLLRIAAVAAALGVMPMGAQALDFDGYMHQADISLQSNLLFDFAQEGPWARSFEPNGGFEIGYTFLFWNWLHFNGTMGIYPVALKKGSEHFGLDVSANARLVLPVFEVWRPFLGVGLSFQSHLGDPAQRMMNFGPKFTLAPAVFVSGAKYFSIAEISLTRLLFKETEGPWALSLPVVLFRIGYRFGGDGMERQKEKDSRQVATGTTVLGYPEFAKEPEPDRPPEYTPELFDELLEGSEETGAAGEEEVFDEFADDYEDPGVELELEADASAEVGAEVETSTTPATATTPATTTTAPAATTTATGTATAGVNVTSTSSTRTTRTGSGA